MLQKVTMPDYSWKLIGIPIQLCQLKGTLGLPALLQKRLYFPAKHSLNSQSVRHNYTGVLKSLNKPDFQMAIPAVTREYTTGACRNLIKLMRLPIRCKMRPDSPAFHAEEFQVPNQRRKEPRFPWWNWRASPRTLSQQEKNTHVTSRMQNRLVYPKSTQDEAHFPFIESIAISHSTSYTSSGLTYFTTIQRFPETPIWSL